MKQTAYIRVSTQNQSYDRQLFAFNEYFTRRGIDPSTVEFVCEKVTSYTKFTERDIYKILLNSEPGDIIYACQLDRFGRTVQDVLDLVNFATNKGVELITLDGHTIENKTPMGQMIVIMLAAFAQMERSLRAERCAAGKEAEKAELEKHGYRIARVSGKIQTHMGNEKGCDMSAAREAAYAGQAKKLLEWKSSSIAYKWTMERVALGWPRKEIIAEFNKLHELQPDVFCSRRGAKLSCGLLSRWINELGN